MSESSMLGVVIRQRRIELGWTQEELAERISSDGEYVRQSEISRIESGKVGLPRHERLVRLADVLDLPLGELLARSGWTGADQHFHVADGDPTATNHTDELVSTVPMEGMPARKRRQPVNETDASAMPALRRAVSTMRDESERLNRNCERSLELVEQVRRSGSIRIRTHDDYLDPSAT
ncbi:MAG TPA: helix-turn-helix transcriptional regulator [Thermomicrobiales bacterium]|nr:helix-turn-helix transcriptional regulator [Thermomicrobiales bacterium]